MFYAFFAIFSIIQVFKYSDESLARNDSYRQI